MIKPVSVLIFFSLCGIISFTEAANLVKFQTSSGDIVLELDSAKAPITVANFLKYVRSSFYNGTIFHRVIAGFMIQGGGLTVDLAEKKTDPPIRNEAYNGLKNVTGTIAMARETPPHTATSQFYINTVNNTSLNYKDSSSNTRWGYCVFGKVIEGMSVVQAIEKVPTESVGSFDDVPKTPIIITKAEELTTNITHSYLKKASLPAITFQTGKTFFSAVVVTDKNAGFVLYNAEGKRVLSSSGIKPGHNVIQLKKPASGIYIFGIIIGNVLVKSGNVLIQ